MSALVPSHSQTTDEFLLIVDNQLLDTSLFEGYRPISIFTPLESNNPYRLSYETLRARSKTHSEFYSKVLSIASNCFEKIEMAAGAQTSRLLRPSLIYATNILVDRSIRVIQQTNRLAQDGEQQPSILEVENCFPLNHLRDFKNNWHFNQWICHAIGKAIGLKSVRIDSHHHANQLPEMKDTGVEQNLLFFPQKSGFLSKVQKKWDRLIWHWGRLENAKSGVLSLGFDADHFYLAKANLLGPFGLFRSLPKNFKLVAGSLDKTKREILRSEIDSHCGPLFYQFFSRLIQSEKIQISEAHIQQISKLWSDLFVNLIPTSHLESLPSNLMPLREFIRTNEIKYVTGHDLAKPLSFLATTAAKLEGAQIIGVQHGGHYGYIDDLALMGLLEYPTYDQMITWGWTEIDPHLHPVKTVPLPSPKLSSRPMHYRPEKTSDQPSRRRKILYMSNLFHRFPTISHCGQARVDALDEIFEAEYQLVKAFKERKIHLYHKPYARRFISLYSEHYKKLAELGENYYQLVDPITKGLYGKIYDDYDLILWDQIGSGTLECFTSFAPTMIYWNQSYSKPAKSALGQIKDLEKSGLLFSDAHSLTQQLEEFFKNPKAWTQSATRKSAIQSFSKSFALTDPHWEQSWRDFWHPLSKSSVEINHPEKGLMYESPK